MKSRGYQLPLGTNVLRMKSLMLNDDNSYIKNYYQIGPKTIRMTSLLRLLESILDPKAFDFLRSKEQLGYSVGVNVENNGEILALSIYVASQEHKHSYNEIYRKLDTFMNDIAKKAIDELTDEEFDSFKEARIKMLSAEDLEIEAEVGRNWNDIVRLEYLFSRLEKSIEITKTLSKSDLQDFFKSFTQPENMRKLSVQVIGNQQSEENSTTLVKDYNIEFLTDKLNDDESVIVNIEEFQSKLFLYPIVLPEVFAK